MSLSTPAADSTSQGLVGAARETRLNDLGLFPLLALTTALGVFLQALAYEGGRTSAPWSCTLYWIALLLEFVPISVRLISSQPGRTERLCLVILLGLSLYLTKYFYSPFVFKFEDELQQWRSVSNLLTTGHLFEPNPILEVSPYYPGLQIAISALVSAAGLDIFWAGVVLIAVMRVVLMIALFLLYEHVSESAHIAGIAAAVYATNPGFLVWGSYVVYQSLALPLAVLALYAIVRWTRASKKNRTGLLITLLLAELAIIMTHHITSYMLNGFLLLWVIGIAIWNRFDVDLAIHNIRKAAREGQLSLKAIWVALQISQNQQHEVRQHEQNQPPILWIATLFAVATILWIVYVATITVDYLQPQFANIVREIESVLMQEATTRSTFVLPDRPLIELGIGIAAIALLLVVLPVSVTFAWKRYYDDPFTVSLAVGSLGYGLVLLIRFASSRGGELLSRVWPFLFIMASFPIAVAVVEIRKIDRFRQLARYLAPAVLAFLFAGGIVNGWPPYSSRLPGPYLISARERSVDIEGIAAAQWARDALGPGHHVAGDWTSYFLMGSYGHQTPFNDVNSLFLSPRLEAHSLDLIRADQLEYLVVNYRFTEMLPIDNYYYEWWEPGAGRYQSPLRRELLDKFETTVGVRRVYDGGDIVIYDIKALAGIDD